MRNAQISPRQVSRILLFANLLFATAFLLVASRTWIEPELAHIPGASGGAGLVWFVTAVPVLAMATLLNLGVLLWCCVKRARSGAWPATRVAWLIVLVWVSVLAFDNWHHGT